MKTTAFIRLTVTAALLFSPIAALAQSSPAAMATVANNSVANTPSAGDGRSEAAPVSAAPEDKKICKQLPSSYSRMTKRACLTEREWKQVEDQAQ